MTISDSTGPGQLLSVRYARDGERTRTSATAVSDQDDIRVTASYRRPSTIASNGYDCSVLVVLSDRAMSGTATVVPWVDGQPGYTPFGDEVSHWISDSLLADLTHLGDWDFGRVVGAIEATACALAEAVI